MTIGVRRGLITSYTIVSGGSGSCYQGSLVQGVGPDGSLRDLFCSGGGALSLRAYAEDVGREIPVVRGKAEKSPRSASVTGRVIPYVLDSGPLDNPSDE
ncbi:MAG: hypothetical protein AABZ47_15790, partial [Planctomycetota bacterium]